MEEVDWWDDAGEDLYSSAAADQVRTPPRPFHPELCQVSHRCPSPPLDAQDEAAKIKSLVETPALDWNSHRPLRRSYVNRRGDRTSTAAAGVPALKKPPPGYVCRRCNEPGHFIQHCPTNGDPKYDVKKVRPPAGIPKSMLVASSDGSLVLPSGDVAVLKPDETAFEKAMECLPSSTTRAAVREIPPELLCPLCRDVMKDAVMTSKCCFGSYCDQCIRGYMISKSKCVCGAADVLADDLIPNMTLRGAIKGILESSSSSSNTGSSKTGVSSVQSAAPSSPALSASTRNDKKKSFSGDDNAAVAEAAEEKRIRGCDDGEQVKKRKKRAKDLAGGGGGGETQWGCDYNAANYMNGYANAMQWGADYNGYSVAEQQYMMPAYMGYNYNAAVFGVPTHYIQPALLPDLSELVARHRNNGIEMDRRNSRPKEHCQWREEEEQRRESPVQ